MMGTSTRYLPLNKVVIRLPIVSGVILKKSIYIMEAIFKLIITYIKLTEDRFPLSIYRPFNLTV